MMKTRAIFLSLLFFVIPQFSFAELINGYLKPRGWMEMDLYVQWNFAMENLPADEDGKVETVIKFSPVCSDQNQECNKEEMVPFLLTRTSYKKGSCRWRKHIAEDKTEKLRIRKLEMLDFRRCKGKGDANFVYAYFTDKDGNYLVWEGERTLSNSESDSEN